jgi:methyltransferase (TIGR00027 family)
MPIQDITDTALLTAFARAQESARSDALFRDPFATKMAGDRGAALAAESVNFPTMAASIGCRTQVFDELLLQVIERNGVQLVLNLAAGLDTRPFRMKLPSSLSWVDADLEPVLDYKSHCLGDAQPVCQYEQVPVDLRDSDDVCAVLEHVDSTDVALVLTEGLLVYLNEPMVASMAGRLRATQSIRWWITDIAGPRALAMMASSWGNLLQGALFQFAPADAPAFFGRCGWRETEFRSSQEEAQRLGRAPDQGFASKMALRAAPASVKEEIRRLSGVAVLARTE